MEDFENYVGKRLDGRYEMLEIIGIGGMAVVYKAHDNTSDKIVAVKVLKKKYCNDPETQRRFRNESRAISTLNHRNIVKIYDVSFGNVIQYIAMEYVDGITLKEYIEQQKVIPIREALHFIKQILRAIQHAHDSGIYHRDIKPQNIMLTSDGTIKVTDFGIARLSRADSRTQTDFADVIGSVQYMSPEQIRGGVTDAKTDIYSIGIVLYEMLTGCVPFNADTIARVIAMQLNEEPRKPTAINSEIPYGLEQIILRSMTKNKSYRYQTASEMLVDIELISRDPYMTFNYNFFVDKAPTRSITRSEVDEAKKQAPAKQREVRYREPTMSSEQADEAIKKENRSTKRILITFLIILILVGAMAGGMYYYFTNGADKVDVPSLVGLNYSTDVMNNSQYSMFSFKVVGEDNDTVDEGVILSQNPTGGRVARGSLIEIHIAQSNDEVSVPDVYGYDYIQAENELKSQNFVVVIQKQSSETVSPGKVIRTNPARSESVPSGAEITLIVATGPDDEKIPVPDIVGKSLSEAKAMLEEVGLKLDSEKTEYRSNIAERGTVIGCDKLGEKVEKGTAIVVYVSSGRETTTERTTESETERTTVSTTASTAPSTTAQTTVSTTAAAEPSTTKATTVATTEPDTTEKQTTEKHETEEPSSEVEDDKPVLE